MTVRGAARILRRFISIAEEARRDLPSGLRTQTNLAGDEFAEVGPISASHIVDARALRRRGFRSSDHRYALDRTTDRAPSFLTHLLRCFSFFRGAHSLWILHALRKYHVHYDEKQEGTMMTRTNTFADRATRTQSAPRDWEEIGWRGFLLPGMVERFDFGSGCFVSGISGLCGNRLSCSAWTTKPAPSPLIRWAAAWESGGPSPCLLEPFRHKFFSDYRDAPIVTSDWTSAPSSRTNSPEPYRSHIRLRYVSPVRSRGERSECA